MLQEEWKMNAIFFEDGCGDVSLGGIQLVMLENRRFVE